MIFAREAYKPTRFEVSPSDLARAEHITKVRSLSPDNHKFYTEVEKCSDALRKTNHFLEEIRHGGWRIRQVEKDIEETRLEKRTAGFLKRKQLDFTLRSLAKECDKEVAHRERRLPHNIEGVREKIDEFRKECVKWYLKSNITRGVHESLCNRRFDSRFTYSKIICVGWR